jgi:pullulanase/glycogen debranching enzyme
MAGTRQCCQTAWVYIVTTFIADTVKIFTLKLPADGFDFDISAVFKKVICSIDFVSHGNS